MGDWSPSPLGVGANLGLNIVPAPSGDTTGATDYANIAAALAANAINNRPLWLGPGIYQINQPIVVTRDYFNIWGCGKARTQIQAVAAMAQVLQVNGVVEANIRDLTLDGNSLANYELDLQHTEGTTRHVIERVRGLGNQVAPVSNTNGDGTITSTQTAFTSATGAFTAADVGKRIIVIGAGAGGANLVTTIAAFVSATAVTLAAAAGTSVTTANYQYWGCSLNNSGCEDVSWFKCEVSGSEVSPSTLNPAMFIQTPSGLQNLYGCDIFGPVFWNCLDIGFYGGNYGPLVCNNAAGSQALQLCAYGCWLYDGGNPTSYRPIDAAATFLGTTTLDSCHLVAALSSGWCNGRLPTGNKLVLRENVYVQPAGNANTTMTLFTTTSSTRSASIVDGGKLSIGGSMTTLALNSGGSSSHTVDIRGYIDGATTYSNTGTVFNTPSVPASGTAQVNSSAKWADVYILSGGATITSITINGTSVGVTSLSATDPTLFRVPPMGTITLTYSVATPTWVWI